MTTPRLSALHIYPVKSLRAVRMQEAVVEPWGLAGDRRWMLVGAGTDTALTQREHPRLTLLAALPVGGGGLRLTAPGQPPLTVVPPAAGPLRTVRLFSRTLDVLPAGAEADAWFSAFLGVPVRLVHLDDPAVRRPIDPDYALPGETVSLADGFPLLVTTTGSLEALNELIAAGDRAGEGPLPMDRFRPNAVIDGTAPWAEDGWRRVRIGQVAFRVPKPCARCVVTTTDQDTGARGKEPLRTLGRHRRVGSGLLFGQNLIPEHPGTLRVGDPLTTLE
ncbi:MOSC domain-containing protein [Actinacidiphila bryophytorum]|uniref:MOSC domain-containing protein n=1 Tax=Actinacidiphila bryophytorum TaxID=1436133 RepID=A0A9W4GYS2_9ACTN|nr:MOSC N-terminal beta barrel domain-containing protein [Actinacidiphila bryophytorum]MBM9439289.1 MOSC domain-containing protein [Actinacidiphila bryophytorum]MBN6546973.1 MOSC domain-containing protein [Actinacidiphila bryophytorum]CAG7619369.1 MOSC domain-containing protein [Actinacidiphila bryophytorum]